MAGREDQEMLASPWNSGYSHIDTPSQPQSRFENMSFANIGSQRSPPWAPLFAGNGDPNERLPVDRYNFQEFRSPYMPSDTGTIPSDSGFGGEIHRPPTFVTVPSVQGDDMSPSPDAKRMEHLMGGFHLGPSRKTPTVDMQTGRPCFRCSECNQAFENNSKLK